MRREDLQRCLQYTRLRLDAALREIDDVRDQDLAYRDVEEALDRIAKILVTHRERIERPLGRREDLRTKDCLDALDDIRVYLPFVGVIVRSAAVRNAFEIYGPLRKLAQQLLKQDNASEIRLILSSGWDYTPLTFRPIEEFEDFVIIVLPACESSNALLVPLAGHELGHAVWEAEKLGLNLREELALALTRHVCADRGGFPDLEQFRELTETEARAKLERDKNFARPFGDARLWLERQLEEIFCDFVGLYLFGESFLYAFAYFLSPDFPGRQSPKYPSVRTRFTQLRRAAQYYEKQWGRGRYRVPDLNQMFETEAVHPRRHFQELLISMRSPWREAVNTVAVQLVPALLSRITELAKRTNWQELRQFSIAQYKEIQDRAFRWAVPAKNAGCLANIVNAAWQVERDPLYWKPLPSLANVKEEDWEQRRREVLSELVLKSIEVLEYEDITRKKLPNAPT